MPYSAEISRVHPGCFLFLIDQSGSMQDPIPDGTGQRKSEVVATALNRLLQELSLRCAREEGIRDYFNVSVLGYGASVGPTLSGTLSGRDIVKLSEIANAPARIEDRTKRESDGAGGVFERPIKLPIWLDPVANGGTPMTEALRRGTDILRGWVDQNPASFPPVALNLTDGEATDGDPTAQATQLASLATNDGPAMLFNLMVSSAGGQPIVFPDNEGSLPNDYAKMLFRISSYLTDAMRNYARSQGLSATDASKGLVYNADVVSIVQFLDIGTRGTDLR
jgi:hypothetical protein